MEVLVTAAAISRARLQISHGSEITENGLLPNKLNYISIWVTGGIRKGIRPTLLLCCWNIALYMRRREEAHKRGRTQYFCISIVW